MKVVLKKDKFGRFIADNKNISLDDYLLQSESDSDSESETATDRLKQHPIKLMLRAIGTPNYSIRFIIQR